MIKPMSQPFERIEPLKPFKHLSFAKIKKRFRLEKRFFKKLSEIIFPCYTLS